MQTFKGIHISTSISYMHPHILEFIFIFIQFKMFSNFLCDFFLGDLEMYCFISMYLGNFPSTFPVTDFWFYSMVWNILCDFGPKFIETCVTDHSLVCHCAVLAEGLCAVVTGQNEVNIS